MIVICEGGGGGGGGGLITVAAIILQRSPFYVKQQLTAHIKSSTKNNCQTEVRVTLLVRHLSTNQKSSNRRPGDNIDTSFIYEQKIII